MALRQLTKLYGDLVIQHRPLKSVPDGQACCPQATPPNLRNATGHWNRRKDLELEFRFVFQLDTKYIFLPLVAELTAQTLGGSRITC